MDSGRTSLFALSTIGLIALAIKLNLSIIAIFTLLLAIIVTIKFLKLDDGGRGDVSPNPKPKHFEVSELRIYPIKSCGGVSVDRAMLERRGLRYDREYAICVRADAIGGEQEWANVDIWKDNADVNAQYLCVSARELPKLLLIQPKIVHGTDSKTSSSSGTLVLTAPAAFGLPELAIKGPGSKGSVTCQAWGAAIKAVDMGDEASKWLADFFAIAHKGRKRKPGDYPYSKVGSNGDPEQPGVLRLMKFADRENAKSSTLNKSVGAPRFADGMPVLIASEATKKAVWEAAWGANAKESSDVTGRRFRWNILISARHGSTPAAFVEDEMASATFFEEASDPNGPVARWTVAGELEFLKPCPRCVLPTTNPDTGERDGLKVSGALKRALGRTAGAMAGQRSYWNWFYKKQVQKSCAADHYWGMNAAIKGASWELGGRPDAVRPFEVFVGQTLDPKYGPSST